MNAVNLIPSDRRKRNAGLTLSPLTLGVVGGLLIVLVAVVVYVFSVNDVRARKSELARVSANAASWQAAANSYSSYVTAAEQQKQQLADIRQLVTGRFPWSLLLSQIGAVMPANSALSSLTATSPSADSSAATGATTAPTSQTVQISGCAATQSAVAATMVELGRVHGVGSVSLASTTNSGAASSSAGASGSASSASGSSSSGGCGFPVTFSLSLVLTAPATSSATAGSTPAVPSTTAPAATPTASTAATPSTGSPQ
jgi:Tfp pilus assembly protein PilN